MRALAITLVAKEKTAQANPIGSNAMAWGAWNRVEDLEDGKVE